MVRSAQRTRIVLGTLLVLGVAGLFAVDWWLEVRWAVGSVATLLGAAGFLEFARLAGLGRRTGRSLIALGLGGTLWGLGVAWAEGCYGPLPGSWHVAGVVGVLIGATARLAPREDHVEAFPELLGCLLGVVLFGVLYPWVLRLYLAGGPDAALVRGAVFFLGVKGTDIVAYLVGRAVGRRRFLKASPAKTLEGYGAALAFGGAWFAGGAVVFPDHFFGWSAGLAFGIILALSSFLGDLAESLIKRYYGVKDSGALLPEFGGVLDLIDSFVFSAFLYWCFLPPAT